MGILANTVSICQFKVLGDLPKDSLFEWASENLAKQGFRSIDHTSEELSFGWVHLDDPKDASFGEPRAFWRDRYLAFSLRRDQRKVPAGLLKAHIERAEAEFLAAHPGMQRLPKQKKEELRDAVHGSLLAKTLPAPAVFDAVWDTESGLVTFTSLNAKTVELFENLFKQTFENLRLLAIHPYGRAEGLLEPPHLEALKQANQAGTDAALDLIKDNQWLGHDFLLWLMYQTMEGSSLYTVDQQGPAASGDSFAAYLNDRLILLGGADCGMQKVTVIGPQDAFAEVRTALQGGKQITEAILYLEKQENQWKLTLKGEMFHFASFKAPAVKIEKDNRTDEASEKEAVFYERMHVLEEGVQLFDSLYHRFLLQRLGPHWEETAGAINTWLGRDQAAA